MLTAAFANGRRIGSWHVVAHLRQAPIHYIPSSKTEAVERLSFAYLRELSWAVQMRFSLFCRRLAGDGLAFFWANRRSSGYFGRATGLLQGIVN